MNSIQREKGFTLIEVLLVLVIASSLIVMFINFTGQQANQQRRDITTLRMQQVLNAALAFYNQNGRWPSLTATPTQSGLVALTTASELVGNNYLIRMGSSGTWVSSYGSTIYAGFEPTRNIFYVAVSLPAAAPSPANAQMIAGLLPSGITLPSGSVPGLPPSPGACSSGQSCYILASVPPPGQNLNNARSVNFASVYHSSACVPAPSCPVGMMPQIFVIPVSVSGVNDSPTNCTDNNATNCTVNVYPISSYTGYAIAKTSGTDSGPMKYHLTPYNSGSLTTSNPAPYYLQTPTDSIIPNCGITNPATTATCIGSYDSSGNPSNLPGSAVPGYFWRVCLGVITERGLVQPTSVGSYPSAWGALEGTVMAVTRCVPMGEATGSTFNVFTPGAN